MDRRTIGAIAICILFLLAYPYILRWLGLGRYIEPQRPVATAPDTLREGGTAPTESIRATGPGERSTPPATPTDPGWRPATRGAAAPVAEERLIRVDTPLYEAVFSTRGARLVSSTLKRYATAHSLASGDLRRQARGRDYPEWARVQLAGSPCVALDLGSGPTLRSLAFADYAASESLDAAGQVRAVIFTLRDSAGLTVRQIYRVRPQDYALDLSVEVSGAEATRVSDYSITTRSWPLVTEADPQADERTLRATSLVGDNIHREGVGGLIKNPKTFDGSAVWAAVQTRYFLAAVAIVEGPARGVRSAGERRRLDPAALIDPKMRPDQEVAVNSLVVGLPTAQTPVHRFLVYVGPSEYFKLQPYGIELDRAVDLGWSWILPFSTLLLRLMNWLYWMLTNYGVAIIALATLVRVVLHPLNMASMKSMRNMAKLQPEVERIRAKYKNDPQAMNASVMALYKEHKVNPAGGCLPLLLQMPLLLGLYQVLFNAIELRQAPFVAWIMDLSAPDELFRVAGFPIRMLPLLMTGSGLLQQKLTPTDPRQQPTMYLMNVMMLVFFYGLPSGLVLYWTVMNLLTALQQWLLMRQDKRPSEAVVVAAPEVGRRGTKR